VKESVKISNPAYSVDRIVARMKEAAARKGQVPEGASSAVVTSAEFRAMSRGQSMLADIDIETLRLQPAFHPSSDGRYHVNDLLKYHDRNFIQNAYRAILKRGPDATGYRGFIESLRSARLNKIDILARLRYSAEGRSRQVEIEGLRLPALIRKAYRLPVVGYLLNLSVALTRLPLTIRGQQQFEAHMLAQQEMVVAHLNHVGHTLRTHAAEVSRALQSQSQSISDLRSQSQQQIDKASRQIDQAKGQIEETRQQLVLLAEAQSAFRQDMIDRLASQTENTKALLSELKEQLNAQLDIHLNEVRQQLTARVDQETAERESDRQILDERIAAAVSQWQENFGGFEARLLHWQGVLRMREAQLHQADLSQREQLEQSAQTLKREVDRVYQKQQEVSTELVLQGERLAVVLTEAGKRLAEPFDEAQLRKLAAEEGHSLDAFYASFDERFRGSREEIKQRLQVYLPLIRQQATGSAAMPLLDVGCGRGEWLELLKEEELQASGVDSNRVLTEWCRSRGLEVTEEDLITFMQRQPDSSYSALTGFHIIEHLSIDTLVDFLNQTVRVLQPGGVVIFETPNPQNVLVGSCNFYFDPTHRNPLPSQVTTFLLESRGFTGVQVLNLNPSDDTPVAEDSDLARRFNKYFYGPMDYAVMGYRP
jgi:2-polyprenyl-3-methyl-5-hydroxy-6-metoxy-1,4-benzoquinol methylase